MELFANNRKTTIFQRRYKLKLSCDGGARSQPPPKMAVRSNNFNFDRKPKELIYVAIADNDDDDDGEMLQPDEEANGSGHACQRIECQ